MSVIIKTKHAIAVAEKYGFESVISIDATCFDHMPAGIHLKEAGELTGFDCRVVDRTGTSREVFTMVDGVKVYVVLAIEEVLFHEPSSCPTV